MPAAPDEVHPGASRVGIHDRLDPPKADTVIGKIGLILQAFSTDNATLGLSEIARTTGIPKATTFRLTRDMAGLGLLDRVDSQFRLGLRLFELGSMVQRQRVLHEVAAPFLQDLRRATNETVHLAIPVDGEVMYAARLAGHQSDAAPSRLAGRMPMHSTATGKAMLAHLPQPLVDALMAKPLRAETRFTVVVPHVLTEQLEVVRETGVAYENEESVLQFHSVAAPIFGPSRRLLGAVSVTGPVNRMSEQAAKTAIRSIGAQISEQAASSWDLV